MHPLDPVSPAILSRVVKPARYTGHEWNSVVKDLNSVTVSFVLAMPDVYEVGMSNLGLKILYQILNERPDTFAERTYAPWVDMEAEMRNTGIRLYTLETKRPVADCDIVGFSLQYELSYSNVLNMLDLAGIPLLAADRDETHPLIVCGGPCAFNAEPMADFVDFFILGEAEDVIGEVSAAVAAWKRSGKPQGKAGILKQLAGIRGIYVPAFYEAEYHADGRSASIRPLVPEAKPVITKRVIQDLDQVMFATKPIVPFIEIVHDRIMLELFRGCTRGCRFCQAGVLYRPVRERKMETLINYVQELIDNTGYNEISLVSLSSADYSCLSHLITQLTTRFKQQGVSVSLPSLRIDSFSIDLAKQVQQVRKSGLTFAPEAGTQRLRDVINKGVTEEDLTAAVSAAFKSGWSTIKLYFMIGLPTETDEDIVGIATLAQRVADLYKQIKGRKGAKVTVSVSSFVPKPHTAFQWFGQDSVEEIERKQRLLRSLIKDRSISLSWHDARTSFLEGVFSRGDRRLGKVLLRAWQNGVKFDGWSEHFKYGVWMEAFAAENIDPAFYASRHRDQDEDLPWEHLSSGVDNSFLVREWQAAQQEAFTPDCRRELCGACGVCQGLDVKVVDWGQA
ncbi:TIGR03960 family B12-binding radical SAM protein [Sporomusa sp.]|uniref:TIGR03960 family B12-binding radical SAM protein n=1 Tax=Sporomusa sp. TaxID=2078658 RepID=UPI002C72520B|nr:TIGR03960 family B12-binding radical SAM protein [Sporomusa sp.]HWR41576.1 TIGR03960 family B12-binding radical SAM protein [Sporomusa sp.]